jgi:Zn-dependent metalloprotease
MVCVLPFFLSVDNINGQVLDFIDKTRQFLPDRIRSVAEEKSRRDISDTAYSRLSTKLTSRNLRLFGDLTVIVRNYTDDSVLFNNTKMNSFPPAEDVAPSARYTAMVAFMYRSISNQLFKSYLGDLVPMVSRVYFPFFNAQYVGDGVNIGRGMATADVLSHEWSHGYTSATSNLLYAYQSGAINEAMSDMYAI